MKTNLFGKSTRYLNWVTKLDERTCVPCKDLNGKIYVRGEEIDPKPPLHLHDRCRIKAMKCVEAGEATDLELDGADYWIYYYDALPDYYLRKPLAEKAGWKRGKNTLDQVLPGMMIGGDIYHNRDGHLPDLPGRVWYEADLDYYGGKRGTKRLLYSNDGLLFVSYDHYHTFVEVVDNDVQWRFA